MLVPSDRKNARTVGQQEGEILWCMIEVHQLIADIDGNHTTNPCAHRKREAAVTGANLQEDLGLD
jgi:hypothetical protein